MDPSQGRAPGASKVSGLASDILTKPHVHLGRPQMPSTRSSLCPLPSKDGQVLGPSADFSCIPAAQSPTDLGNLSRGGR